MVLFFALCLPAALSATAATPPGEALATPNADAHVEQPAATEVTSEELKPLVSASPQHLTEQQVRQILTATAAPGAAASSCKAKSVACCGGCSISCGKGEAAHCVTGAFRWDVNGKCKCTRKPRCYCD
ncbi:MAG: hypothetical protein DWQ36_14665 [Acidobacteria bacterium]|nr:MAG: hypothetical protein DWQ30_03400 [Acidobacteriota bacterium]REK06134.1 MAG: hypothetical protein DWQ36_14665 [Acidobacteriota bacterium]